LRKILVLIAVFILFSSLSTFAKATYTFENEGEDTVFIASQTYFYILKRTNTMSYNGEYSLMAVLEDTSQLGSGGTTWWIHTRHEPDPLVHDLEFWDDTLFMWMYLPDGYDAEMSFIQPFTQDTFWGWHGNWQSWAGCPKDQWACYYTVISDETWDGSPRYLPIWRAGVEFGSAVTEPACTVYIDDISTEGRHAGVETITEHDGIKVPVGSINYIEFDLATSTSTLVEMYNITGQKVAVPHSGVLGAGPHSIRVPNDLPNGVYMVKITAGLAPVKISKVLVAR
jgi:hypothetical protein